MNKNFISGLATGLFGALLLMIIVFTIVGPIRTYSSTDEPGKQEESNRGITSFISDLFGEDKEDNPKETDNEVFEQKRMTINTLINQYYYKDVDASVLNEGMLRGMVESLNDPYSSYYNDSEFAELLSSSSGIYCGIGATVTQNPETLIMTIVTPFENCPAFNAGMCPGDIITAINGENVVGQKLDDVVAKMRGTDGTKVVVTVIREDVENPIDLNITRAKIEVPTVTYKMLKNKVGYINISEFDKITSKQFETAVNALETEGAKGLVIDLRDNPGGLYDVVVSMLDRVIGKGLLVYTEDKHGKKEEEYAVTDEAYDKPISVIINGNSASASEIFAGCLQDYGSATIVGTQSYGKGIVQSVIPLGIDNTALKITVSRYFTPNGECIHGVGITPDILIELDEGLEKQVISIRENDNQIDAAAKAVLDKLNK